MREDEWNKIVQDIRFDYIRDSYFTELKNTEIMKSRLELLRDIEDHIGTYFSRDYVRKNILRQTDPEIRDMDRQIDKEKAEGDIDMEDGGEPDGER